MQMKMMRIPSFYPIDKSTFQLTTPFRFQLNSFHFGWASFWVTERKSVRAWVCVCVCVSEWEKEVDRWVSSFETCWTTGKTNANSDKKKTDLEETAAL